ncbi:MAG: C39 family peptidase [Pseudomonadota bacterium]
MDAGVHTRAMSAARLLVLALLASACRAASAPAEPALVEPPPAEAAQPWPSVLLDAAPHVRQEPDFCGEACVEMALRGMGHDLDQDAVFALTGVDPALGRGAWTPELAHALEALGFDVGPVWTNFDHEPTPDELDVAWSALHVDLIAGIPSIVCTRTTPHPRSSEHFRLILGYDAATDEVVYHEPAEDDGAFRRMRRRDLYAAWPLHGRAGATLIRLRLAPGELHLPARSSGRSPADYAQHVLALREHLPAGFTVAVEPPFVVVGDEDPERVRARAEGTVRAFARGLERDFFAQPPAEIFTIWLFKDDASYRRHTRELWREDPDTPYGYATEDGNRLVMNIATGGGTLVHELVHAYIHTDFPGCPPWLDEGLASLFEHVSLQDGHPVGHTNWRLDGLLRAIEVGAVPSLRWLTSQSSRQFYLEDPGTNYAQSRYLCQYAQERGVLRDLYRQARERHAADPTGYATLTEVLGIHDHAAFLERWQAWAVGLAELPDGE